MRFRYINQSIDKGMDVDEKRCEEKCVDEVSEVTLSLTEKILEGNLYHNGLFSVMIDVLPGRSIVGSSLSSYSTVL
jgi:hypothetical protein